MRVEFRGARPDDVEIAGRLRADDLAELRAARGPNVRRTVAEALMFSKGSGWACEIDGELAAIFGFAPYSLTSDTAAPWLLGTDALTRIPRVLVAQGRCYCREALGRFPVLRNFVDARNVVSIRWLRRIGFDILPAVPFGVEQLPFHPFEMRG